MKMMRNVAFLLFPLLYHSGAFLMHPFIRSARVVVLRSSPLQSKAEDHLHLQDLATEWEKLGTRVKEFANSPTTKSQAGELTTMFLHTAIDHAHTQEEIEQEHAIQAHQEFEDALQEEDTLRMTMPLLVDETDHWMEPYRICTRLAENGTFLKKPFYRYLVNEKDPVVVNGEDDDFDHRPADPNQIANDYRQSLLQTLHQKEVLAQEDEAEAKRTLEELRKNEEQLKETLMEFEALQEKQKEKLDDLKMIKKRRERKRLLNELA